jgi:hypothetical protein
MIAPEIYNALNKWATMVVALAKANLLRGKKDATFTLSKSIGYEIVADQTSDIGADVEFYYIDYGDYVESGRKKYPNRGINPEGEFFSKLLNWIKVKPIPRFRDKKGRFISYQSQAFLIGRAINKKGIKPFPFMTDAIEQAQNDLLYMLEEAIAEVFTQDLVALQQLRD